MQHAPAPVGQAGHKRETVENACNGAPFSGDRALKGFGPESVVGLIDPPPAGRAASRVRA